MRALIEGQFIAKRVYAEDMGLQIGNTWKNYNFYNLDLFWGNTGPNTKILATGGASINKSILQVAADVFNCPVYTQVVFSSNEIIINLNACFFFKEGCNSAVVGAAYQAKIAMHNKNHSYSEILSHLPEPILTCSPYTDVIQIYKPMMERYRKIIDSLANQKI